MFTSWFLTPVKRLQWSSRSYTDMGLLLCVMSTTIRSVTFHNIVPNFARRGTLRERSSRGTQHIDLPLNYSQNTIASTHSLQKTSQIQFLYHHVQDRVTGVKWYDFKIDTSHLMKHEKSHYRSLRFSDSKRLTRWE